MTDWYNYPNKTVPPHTVGLEVAEQRQPEGEALQEGRDAGAWYAGKCGNIYAYSIRIICSFCHDNSIIIVTKGREA